MTDYFEFEDTDTRLIWGTPVEQLHEKFGTEKRDQGDRTIYAWGERQILNGLRLDLTSRYWNFEEEPKDRIFDHLEFWAVGDKDAKEYFNLISEHLIGKFGEPSEIDEKYPPDRDWKWNNSGITLSLSFFEQHAYKLCFSIRKTK